MRAAVFHGPNQPLRLEDVPQPVPGPGQIVVKVAACGVCHTDLHYIDHGVPTAKKPPLILGHEASGTVAGVGAGVKNFKDGDRVLLPAVLSCGTCFFCRTGRENICQSMVMFGNNIDGAYAEFVLAPAKDAFRMPEEVPPFFVVRQPSGAGDSDPGRDPQVGARFSGLRRDVTVQEVIAAIGPRNPAAEPQAEAWRQAFVFVSVGGPADPALVAKVDKLRSAWEAYFRRSTDDRLAVDPRID